MNTFLGSIKFDPSKAAAIVEREINRATSAQIHAEVSVIRLSADLYFDDNASYIGLCDSSNKKSIEVGANKIFESVLKIVSSNEVYCNASSDAFVYSVDMPSGDTVCADSTGFSGSITADAKTLSCK